MSEDQSLIEEVEFPAWLPAWLKELVEAPDCSAYGGSHQTARQLAKWLTIYLPPETFPGLAFRFLREAADRCDRIPDDGELRRLMEWASSFAGKTRGEADEYYRASRAEINLDFIYEIIVTGPRRAEYRELSPIRLFDCPERQSAALLDMWAAYAGIDDPWVCHGDDNRFYTRRLSNMRDRAKIYQQIVPSPMVAQYGKTKSGWASEHSLEATGSRLFLVNEFDFSLVNAKRQPTIWVPLIKACAQRGYGVLDMNASLSGYLRTKGPLWISVFSGSKSIHSWFASKGRPEEELNKWWREVVLPLGACTSTWCRSQFVRMPDGERSDGNRQSIEYFNPEVLEGDIAK